MKARLLTIALLISLLSPVVATAQDPSAPVLRGSRLQSNSLYYLSEVEEFAWSVLRHLDTVWTNWMLSEGYAEPHATIVLLYPDQVWQSKCGPGGQGSRILGDEKNAFYCPADDAIILPLWFLWDHVHTYDLGQVPGDFALATTIAHEFGHHIVWELLLQAEAMGYNVDLPNGKNEELIADCFAGVWAYAVFLDNFLEDGDLDEAVWSMYDSGDYEYDDPNHHGTPEERAGAWMHGLYGSTAPGYYDQPGTPQNCIIAYWR